MKTDNDGNAIWFFAANKWHCIQRTLNVKDKVHVDRDPDKILSKRRDRVWHSYDLQQFNRRKIGVEFDD